MTDVWIQLAEVYMRQGMLEDATRAYGEVIARNPKDAGSLIGAAGALLRLGRLEEARKHGELAVSVAPAGAHEILAKIALARRDRDEAVKQARLAQEADRTLPMPLYIQGLLLYNQGQYEAALAPLLQAKETMRGRTLQMNDLNYHIGDSLARLERYAEAEPYLLEEIRVFPNNTRARSGLAMLYRAMGRNAESDRAIEEMLRAVPTAETRATAAKLWTMFGEPGKAQRVRIP
jgi:Flp pilus assembly protein TadD